MSPKELASQKVVLLCIKTLRNLLAGADGPVEAVYLWGSIVRPDFVPGRSDIDSVLLGKESRLEEICGWLSAAVAESEPALSNFKARPLYLEDLDGGQPRSELARLIHPRILLTDFENWQLALGRRFTRADFGLTPGSLNEILALRLAALRRRLDVHRGDPGQEPARYILKEVSFICHVIHQMRVGPHPFSYPALLTHANEETREAVRLIISLREGGWEEETCRRALRVAEPFLMRMG
jgi:predicted nucleotidyltransferase